MNLKSNFMKITKLLFILLLSIISFSCEEDDDEPIEPTLAYEPWNERLYNGINQINGIDVYDLEFLPSSTNINLDDYTCAANLPEGNFTTIKLNMIIPKHPTAGYLSGIETFYSNRIVIRYNNGQLTPDVYQSGSINFLGIMNDPFNENIVLSKFSVSAIIPSNYNITKDNLESIEFPFYLIYLDENGNEVHRSERSYTLLNSNC